MSLSSGSLPGAGRLSANSEIGPVEVRLRLGDAAPSQVNLRVGGKSIPARREGDQLVFEVDSILDHEVVEISSR